MRNRITAFGRSTKKERLSLQTWTDVSFFRRNMKWKGFQCRKSIISDFFFVTWFAHASRCFLLSLSTTFLFFLEKTKFSSWNNKKFTHTIASAKKWVVKVCQGCFCFKNKVSLRLNVGHRESRPELRQGIRNFSIQDTIARHTQDWQ